MEHKKPDWLDDDPNLPVEPGYEEWFRAKVEKALREVEEGKTIPAEQVWRELGLED